MDRSYLDWPFFKEEHRAFADELRVWAGAQATDHHEDVDRVCREYVAALGQAGWLSHSAVDPSDADGRLDLRKLCLTRERLAYHDALLDFSFAMQGLGAGPISLFGTQAQREEWLTKTRLGEAIAAFALTEPGSGSDVANIAMSAHLDGDHYVLDGEKTWISNGGIADLYTVFARTGEAEGAKGISAFIVPGDAGGLSVFERLTSISPHPLAHLKFANCQIPKASLIGQGGEGFKIAMSVLDVFRSTVGAAALGFARRALDEALTRVKNRKLRGAPLIDFQMVQAHIADMALEIDAAALLIYRAAWLKDKGAKRISREASMAKLYATEMAQRVIDQAVQIHGGEGVRSGAIVERLYRDIRALRIYEGASDVQKIIIARQTQIQSNSSSSDREE